MRYLPAISARKRSAQSFIYLVLSFLLVAALVPGSALVGLAGTARADVPAHDISPAFVYFTPISKTIAASGATTVQVKINNIYSMTNDTPPVPIGLYGAEVHLSFDPSLFQVVDATPATPATIEITPTVFGLPAANYFVAQNQVDNVAGTIDFAVTLLNPQTPVISPLSPLVSISFQGTGTGVSPLIVNTATLAGVVNFGTPTQESVEIPNIPMPGWIIMGDVPTYDLTLAVNGSGWTIPSTLVSPTHPFPVGTEVKIAALPFAGATFVNWTGPVVDPNNPVTSIIMDADKSATANFSGGQTYTLTMAAAPEGAGGTTPPVGPNTGYAAGTVVPITANPATGWNFINWMGPVANPDNPSTTVTMNSDKTVTANFTQSATRVLTMAVTGSGSVIPGVGAHVRVQGSSQTLVATPADGWQFANWTGPVADPNSPVTTVVMDVDKSVTANFTQGAGQTNSLTMAVTGTGSTAPTVGIHNFPTGAVIGLSAKPALGWIFVNWTGPVADPNSRNTTVTVDADKVVTANFIAGYTLNMGAAPAAGGIVTPGPGSHGYATDTVVNITATPNTGYTFVNWTGPVADPNNPSTTVTMNSDKNVTANFTQSGGPYTLTTAVAPPGSGDTTPAIGVHPGYASGTVVPITATPATGWTFLNWMGPVANPSLPSTTVTMNSDKIVTAHFTQSPTHVLTVAVNGNGRTMPGVGTHTFIEGSMITLTATPDDGWAFVSWTGPVADPNSPVTTVFMDADKNVTANFEEGQGAVNWSLTVATTGTGSTYPPVGTHVYPDTALVAVIAYAAPGWVFESWTGPVSDPGNYITHVTMDGNKSITANFVQGYTLYINAAPGGAGYTTPPPGPNAYPADTVVNISAMAFTGWSFVNWTGPVADPNSAFTTVTMDSDKYVTANFTQSGSGIFTVTMIADPVEGGTVEPAPGPHSGYAGGTQVPITAIPNQGWSFLYWIGPVSNPGSPSTTVMVFGDVSVTAVFVQGETRVLTVAVNGSGGAMPGIGAHNFPDGMTVALVAAPDDGWQFVSWTGPVADPNSPVTTIVMDADKAVTANFMQGSGQNYTLDVAQSGEGYVFPEPGTHTYPSGALIGVGAQPAPGWTFVNWTGPVTNPNAQHTAVIMDANKAITANFSQSGGQPFVETDTFPNSVVVATLTPPTGGPVTLGPAAPSTSQVYFEGPIEGDAHDEDGDGLDEVPTEMLQLNLVGSGPAAGVLVRESPTLASMGQIEENVNNTPGRLDLPPFAPSGNANSFFDVFVELSVDGGQTWTPAVAPLHLEGALTHKPAGPGDTYQGPPGAGMQFVTPGGTFVVQVASYTPNPGQTPTFTLTMAVSPAGAGTTTPAIGTHPGFVAATGVGISASANAGYVFSHWTVTPAGSIGAGDVNNPSTNVAIYADTTVTANFSQETGGQTYTLTMGVSGGGSTLPGEGDHSYNQGDVVDLTANPAEGWAFVNWTGDAVADANDPTTTITMDSDKTVTANFEEVDSAPLSLTPAFDNILVGQVFNVNISTNLAAGNLVSAVDAFVDFDPTKLQVIDADPETEGVQIGQGAALNNVLNNIVDNDAGTIDYSAGKLSSPPNGSFLVATISFRAMADTGGAATPITVSLSGTRTSIVAYSGSPYSGTHIDSAAIIAYDVPLSLLPATNDVTIGQVFPVTINTNAPDGTRIDNVEAYLNFDPALLEVVDDDPAAAGIQIAPGTELTVIPFNEANNSLGQIHYRATVGDVGDPSGSFLVATIHFRAKAETEGTPISISLTGARQSNVTFLGNLVPGTHADSAAVIVYDVPLSLTASGPKAYVDTTFTVTIQTTAAVGQLVSAVDAFVDFDPTYLEVVDADPDTEGIQIADGASLTSHLNNVVDNDAGTIDYSAGKLSSPPSGSFLVATITFKAKVETSGTTTTPVTVSFASPRKSLVAYSGSPVAGSHVDTAVDIDPGATIYGHVSLQGSSRPAANRVVQLTVKLFPAGQYTGNTIINGTPDMTYTPWTVNTGSNNVTFQIDGVVAGTYDILVVAGHTLHSVKRGVVVSPPSVDVYFGNLLEGNANNDNIINALDFSILAASYMKSAGQAGWNAGADFDMTGTVNALDFSLLAANYMKISPQTAP